MLRRCTNPSDVAWPYYGGRGITVCERWQSFEQFLEDMGPRPSDAHSIDRIDGNRGYEPGNCRWATKKEQSRNMRRNRMLTLKGVTKPLAAWADTSGINHKTILARLRGGWTIEDALTVPVGGRQTTS